MKQNLLPFSQIMNTAIAQGAQMHKHISFICADIHKPVSLSLIIPDYFSLTFPVFRHDVILYSTGLFTGLKSGTNRLELPVLKL